MKRNQNFDHNHSQKVLSCRYNIRFFNSALESPFHVKTKDTKLLRPP